MREIAEELSLSSRTVETYCKMLHTKMRSHKVVL
jgi:DNA-binding CsgD family transcriptional regulator